jgi:hypothetical protein
MSLINKCRSPISHSQVSLAGLRGLRGATLVTTHATLHEADYQHHHTQSHTTIRFVHNSNAMYQAISSICAEQDHCIILDVSVR